VDPALSRFPRESLRNLGRTGSCMHNGLFELEGVILMHSVGMPRSEPSEAQKDELLCPRNSPFVERLDPDAQGKDDLGAFLRALTEHKYRIRAPVSPPISDA